MTTTPPSPTGIRFLDTSSTGTMTEIFVQGGEIERSFLGQNGWDRLDDPPLALRLKAKLYGKLAMQPWGPLFRACLETVQSSVRRVQKASATDETAAEDLDRMFAPAAVGRLRKPMLAIDMVEECRAVDQLRDLLHRHGYVGASPMMLGEESLFDPGLDLSRHDRVVILQDTVDGTDEVEQGTGGWCSSMIVFQPREHRILAAVVGLPDGRIYFALDDFVGRCRFVGEDLSIAPTVHMLTGPSGLTALDDSIVSFYGHKPSRLNELAANQLYRALIARLGASTRARVRTHAGQPMMMRLADRSAYRQVDVVLEVLGQAPHDVAAGLHIARLAGAHLCDLDGLPVDLAGILLRPADRRSRLKYLLTASPALSQEILNCRPHPDPSVSFGARDSVKPAIAARVAGY